eukprot:7561004-Pyramimonas_sp.AAC.1
MANKEFVSIKNWLGGFTLWDGKFTVWGGEFTVWGGEFAAGVAELCEHLGDGAEAFFQERLPRGAGG